MVIQSKVAPSVPSLSALESFSPSAFMSGDTRGGLPTFGGVNRFKESRQIDLRSRSGIQIPRRYVQCVIPAKAKRVNKRAADCLVKHFIADSTDGHCGGKVGRGSNVQTCVTPACSCLVSSHATKADSFEENHVYIWTLAKSGRTTIYLIRLFLLET